MKDAIGSRQFKLSNTLLTALTSYKENFLPTVSAFEIARAVQKQSDYYIQFPFGKTPWKEKEAQVAQVFYYLPLNYLRNLSVATEIINLFPELKNKSVIDFGSGLGAAAFAIQEVLYPTHLHAVEISEDAQRISKQLGAVHAFSQELSESIASDTVGWFSYSLTEIKNPMPLVSAFDHLVIVEPSTQKDSQALINLRQTLIDAGYHILAPCTHQKKCPLQGNRSDFCHDKIYFELTEDLLEIENHLNWKNSDLTFSYLVASRTLSSKNTNQIRIIGDAQFEKGKARQMICRGENREFFSWLDRDESYYAIARGAVVDMPVQFELKGNEIRIK